LVYTITSNVCRIGHIGHIFTYCTRYERTRTRTRTRVNYVGENVSDVSEGGVIAGKEGWRRQ